MISLRIKVLFIERFKERMENYRHFALNLENLQLKTQKTQDSKLFSAAAAKNNEGEHHNIQSLRMCF